MRSYFLNNINIKGSGAVVAAPDYNTPGGSYYYHWERDGALSMGALLSTAASVDDVRTEMDAYVGWVSRVQQEVDPHGQSVLAEPTMGCPKSEIQECQHIRCSLANGQFGVGTTSSSTPEPAVTEEVEEERQ